MTALPISQGQTSFEHPFPCTTPRFGVSFLGEGGWNDKKKTLHSILVGIFSPGRGAQGRTPGILTHQLSPSPALAALISGTYEPSPRENCGRRSLTKSSFSPQPQKGPTPCQGPIPPEQTHVVLLQVFCLNSKRRQPLVNYSCCLTRKRSLRVGNA